MNTVEAAKYIKATIHEALSEVSFTPPLPPRRTPRVKPSEPSETLADTEKRDDSASWTIFIEYKDSSGWTSERRITILRFEHTVGGFPLIAARCHECGEHRSFRVDRIVQVVDLETGELLDALSYLADLRQNGLPRVNRGMFSFCRVLAFIARCDGSFHQLEHDAIETALTRYALRFDGETDDVENTLAAIKNMTPDITDLNNALIAILRSPAAVRVGVADLLLRCIGDVIDADGRHTEQEIGWALSLQQCLQVIRQ